VNSHLRRLNDRRAAKAVIYEPALRAIRGNHTATARELRDMARQALEAARR
jgi:hypothetical protein